MLKNKLIRKIKILLIYIIILIFKINKNHY